MGQTKAKGRLAQPAQKKKPGGVTRPGFEGLEKHVASTGCVGCRALYKAAAGGLVPKQEARLARSERPDALHGGCGLTPSLTRMEGELILSRLTGQPYCKCDVP